MDILYIIAGIVTVFKFIEYVYKFIKFIRLRFKKKEVERVYKSDLVQRLMSGEDIISDSSYM